MSLKQATGGLGSRTKFRAYSLFDMTNDVRLNYIAFELYGKLLNVGS